MANNHNTLVWKNNRLIRMQIDKKSATNEDDLQNTFYQYIRDKKEVPVELELARISEVKEKFNTTDTTIEVEDIYEASTELNNYYEELPQVLKMRYKKHEMLKMFKDLEAEEIKAKLENIPKEKTVDEPKKDS